MERAQTEMGKNGAYKRSILIRIHRKTITIESSMKLHNFENSNRIFIEYSFGNDSIEWTKID